MIQIDNNLYIVLLLVFYVMSVYRIAIMITDDTGPLEIFERLRNWIDEKTVIYNDEIEDIDFENHTILYWKWRIMYNLDEGVNCVNCTGVWSAIILAIPLYLALFFPIWALLLVILGGAGIQHYLTDK